MNPKAILSQLNLRARKRTSQNFLTSPHWAEKLTDLVLENNPEAVWEIGPGLGAITSVLVKKNAPNLTVFEIDVKLIDYLKTEFPGLHIIEGDFLKADFEALLSDDKKINLLSNLPYHISSPIFFKLLDHRASFGRLVLTFQKEFADRLIAKHRTPDYGATTVLAQMAFEIENLGLLAPTCFFPKPEVASRALLFTPRLSLPVEWKTFRLLVKQAYLYRRKKMFKNLQREFSTTPWEKIFGELGLSENTRAEELDLETFVRLSQAFAKNKT